MGNQKRQLVIGVSAEKAHRDLKIMSAITGRTNERNLIEEMIFDLYKELNWSE